MWFCVTCVWEKHYISFIKDSRFWSAVVEQIFFHHHCRNCNCAFIKPVDDCQYTMSCFCITCHQNTLPAAACSEIKAIHSNWIHNCKRVPKKVLHYSLLLKIMLLLLLFAILELMEPLLHSFNLLSEQLFMGTRHEVTP